jgi:murein DD-endopeptidase MepM/ murein hydrolase activator NlpD
VNYHAALRDQRFAYDIVVARDGATHSGDGKHNTDYFAYGQAIVAPGDGVVATLEDGVPENVPGEMNPAHAAGNYVIVDHGDGEFPLLAHMIPGSFRVKVGDRVRAGQEIGRCGNSGNSSEPHLHYHV